MVQDGLKIPSDSYLEGRLRNALDGVEKFSFLKDSDEGAIKSLTNYNLIKFEKMTAVTTLAGQKVLEILDGLTLKDNETVATPVGTYIYGSTSASITMSFDAIKEIVQDLSENIINNIEEEDFKQLSFALEENKSCTIIDLTKINLDYAYLVDPSIPIDWLVHDTQGTIITTTEYNRYTQPMYCQAYSALLLGMILNKNNIDPQKIGTSTGIHVEHSIY
ncbi:MAG: hypothetical protein ACTSUV_04255 [Candidatus Ranarchaeia archaeon]